MVPHYYLRNQQFQIYSTKENSDLKYSHITSKYVNLLQKIKELISEKRLSIKPKGVGLFLGVVVESYEVFASNSCGEENTRYVFGTK